MRGIEADVKWCAIAVEESFDNRSYCVVIAIVSLVRAMMMGRCCYLTSLAIIGLLKKLAKALESLTMSHFITTQKTLAVNALALPGGV